MGNILGLENNNEQMSETIPYLQKMQRDARELSKNLNTQIVFNNAIDLVSETETTNNNETYSIFEKVLANTNNIGNTAEFSETSPFISSDMYNDLINKQKGGATFSSSYSGMGTSSKSDSDPEDMVSQNLSTEGGDSDRDADLEMKKDNPSDQSSSSDETATKKVIDMMAESESAESAVSMGSYISSSAHTDGIDSSSENVTTVSIRNKHMLSDSINTSDINMISVED